MESDSDFSAFSRFMEHRNNRSPSRWGLVEKATARVSGQYRRFKSLDLGMPSRDLNPYQVFIGVVASSHSILRVPLTSRHARLTLSLGSRGREEAHAAGQKLGRVIGVIV